MLRAPKQTGVTSLPPHYNHLSTTATFLCPQDARCQEVQLYRYHNHKEHEVYV